MSVNIQTATLPELADSLGKRSEEAKLKYQKAQTLGNESVTDRAYREWMAIDDHFHDVLRLIKNTDEIPWD